MVSSLKIVEQSGHRAAEIPEFNPTSEIRHLFGLRGHRPKEVLAERFGVPVDRIASGQQVHGDSVRVIKTGTGPIETSTQKEHDAMITDQPGVVLAVRSADCVPILLWDVRRKEILTKVSMPKDFALALEGQAMAFQQIWNSLG